MSIKQFRYSLWYKFNFIPWLSLIGILFIVVYILPSKNKAPGYSFLVLLLLYCIVVYLIEKLRVATMITIDDTSIVASRAFREQIVIKYNDVAELVYSGRGLFLVSGKMHKYLYAKIFSVNGKIIIVRRDLAGFDEFVRLIEKKSGREFLEQQ